MKKTVFAFCISAFIASCNNESKTESPASSDTTKTAAVTEVKPMDTTGMAKAWENFMTPGPMHQWLAKFNGTWEADITSYMDPTKPEKSKGTSVYTSSMNGLYQEGKMTSTMMGMSFQGRSTTGYDNAKKMFVSTWIDNLGSGIIYMTGVYDDASKTLILKGQQTDALTGKDSGIREVMKVTDDNSYTMEMYGTGMDGKETKFMDALYKRKK